MRILTAENISKSYGDKLLFNELTFSIGEGQKIGLIGLNGTGKSTLLKAITNEEDLDSGLIKKPHDYTIEFISQQLELEPEKNALEHIFTGNSPEATAIREYEAAVIKLNRDPANEQRQERLTKAQEKMESVNGWDLSANAKTVLTKLGITDFSKPTDKMSGGEKKRVALAVGLLRKPDLLILDEPTNHLDISAIEWLEKYLNQYQRSYILVTHDRYFLDHVTNTIWELNRGQIFSYKGNYQSFLEQKSEREEIEAKQSVKHQALLKKELEWLKKGAKARTTKQKARIQRVEKLQEIQQYEERGTVDLALSGSRIGKKGFELNNVQKQFGNRTLITNFSYIIQPHARIGIVGNNGSGKSTLLKLLSGDVLPDGGSIDVGQTLKIGFYTQENESVDDDQRMIHYIKESAEFITTADGKLVSAAQMLERFLFPPSAHGLPIGKLSGGEKRRLYLLKILMSSPNVLLLDEPTNDLDIETLTVLEDYIDEFTGAVITVSHDRYFLDKTADRLFVFTGNGHIQTYYGSYSDYLEESNVIEQQDVVTNPSKPQEIPVTEPPKKRNKLSYKEQREWNTLENEIETLENKVLELDTEIEASGSDFEKIQALMKNKEECTEKLDYYLERWTILSEKIEELEK